MCPYFSDGVCKLKEGDGEVSDQIRLYYCENRLHAEAFKGCPTYQEKGEA